ncbi:MAG TPA: 4Fe-4S dicluster domain-containing protein [Afifellaceae bacterium]|nr:4Fe-4S dicluster domain-containing protein [Afifellaceae bacterium]
MTEKNRNVLLCTCAETMKVDGGTIGKALGCGDVPVQRQLCRANISAFESALAGGGDLMVGCTQEAPLFSEIAEDAGASGRVGFVNIRERAGWSDAPEATAKMAALIADARQSSRPARLKSIESEGMCLVYGKGQAALDAARTLSGRLSVTLVWSDPDGVILPTVMDFAAYRGTLVRAGGSLGHFEVTLDGYAPMLPSSKAEPEFMMTRDGAQSRCSVIVDLSGGTPPLTGWRKRDGYLRADPGDGLGIAKLLLEASELVGTFEKPIYVDYEAAICAHGQSGITGCTKCLDNCPAGALTSLGDSIAVDDGICGGCGACSSHCPTGAISYAYPQRSDLILRLQAMLGAYRRAGGAEPVILFHDHIHGGELINMMARFGRGLPANVIPFGLHSSGMPGHDIFAAALVSGACRVAVLGNPANAEDLAAVSAEIDLINAILAGLGIGENRVVLFSESDPDRVEETLHGLEPAEAICEAEFAPVGGKRDIARTALSLLHQAAENAPDVIALPDSAPYGRINVDTGGCTLCLACVSACPANALLDNPDKPQLRFVESACVQCGLCVKTCPEKVISLTPQIDFTQKAMQPETLNEEEPAECIRCGKPFGTQSTVNRIRERLAGQHSMFRSEQMSRLIEMCDNCRIEAQAEMEGNPFAAGERPRVRTTQDYLDAEKGLSADDFLIDDQD